MTFSFRSPTFQRQTTNSCCNCKRFLMYCICHRKLKLKEIKKNDTHIINSSDANPGAPMALPLPVIDCTMHPRQPSPDQRGSPCAALCSSSTSFSRQPLLQVIRSQGIWLDAQFCLLLHVPFAFLVRSVLLLCRNCMSRACNFGWVWVGIVQRSDCMPHRHVLDSLAFPSTT